MSNPERAPDSGARPRARKPTPAERREQRAQVESTGEVLDAAARYLEARPRSQAEVQAKLLRLGYRPELVEGVIARLLDLGYLDDEAFARAWVESRDRASPRGEHALRTELGRKGVARDVIVTVLDERREVARTPGGPSGAGDAEAPSADEVAAERLLRKRLVSILREPDARKRRQKAYALLARSGFSPDVCAAVSRSVLESADDDVHEDAGADDDGPALADT